MASNKHETLTQCCFNVGASVEGASRVSRVINMYSVTLTTRSQSDVCKGTLMEKQNNDPVFLRSGVMDERATWWIIITLIIRMWSDIHHYRRTVTSKQLTFLKEAYHNDVCSSIPYSQLKENILFKYKIVSSVLSIYIEYYIKLVTGIFLCCYSEAACF